MVTILNTDVGLAKVGQLEEQLLLDTLKLTRGNLVIVTLGIVIKGEKLLLLRKLGRQKFVDKGHIIIKLTNLKHFLPAQAQLHIPTSLGLNILAILIRFPKFALVPAVLDIPQ